MQGTGDAVLKAPARAALAAFVKRDERAALLTKVERELRSVDAVGPPPTLNRPPRAPPPSSQPSSQPQALQVGCAVSERELVDWRAAKALPEPVLAPRGRALPLASP